MHFPHHLHFQPYHPNTEGSPTYDFLNFLMVLLGVLLALLFYSSKLT